MPLCIFAHKKSRRMFSGLEINALKMGCSPDALMNYSAPMK